MVKKAVDLFSSSSLLQEGSAVIHSNNLNVKTNSLRVSANGMIGSERDMNLQCDRLHLERDSKLFCGGNFQLEGEAGEGSKASEVTNHSGSIEIYGNALLRAKAVSQKNIDFSTEDRIVESVRANHKDPPAVKLRLGFLGFLGLSHGADDEGAYYWDTSHDHTYYDYQKTTRETTITSAKPAKLYVGGTLNFDGSTFLNDKSHVLARNITGNPGAIQTESEKCKRTIEHEGTSVYHWTEWHEGDPEFLGLFGDNEEVLVHRQSNPAPYSRRYEEDISIETARTASNVVPPNIGNQLGVQARVERLNPPGNPLSEPVKITSNPNYVYPGWLNNLPEERMQDYVKDICQKFSVGGSSIVALNQMKLNATTIDNNGGLIDAPKMSLDATTITNNEGGVISGEFVSFKAKEDITNRSGIIKAIKSLQAKAKNIKIETLSSSQRTGNISETTLKSPAVVFVENGDMSLEAKNDIITRAGQVGTKGGNIKLKAKRNISLDEVRVSKRENVVWDKNSRLYRSSSSDVRSIVKASGKVSFEAKGNVVATGAAIIAESPDTKKILSSATSKKGVAKRNQRSSIEIKAGGDVQLKPGKATSSKEEELTSYYEDLFTDSTLHTHRKQKTESCIPNVLVGDSVKITGNGDFYSEGSVFSGKDGVEIRANKIQNEAGQNTFESFDHRSQSVSGFLSSKDMDKTSKMNIKQTQANTIEATEGNVEMEAERQNTQRSNVYGNKIKVSGSEVLILPGQAVQTTKREFNYAQSGIFVSVSNPAKELYDGVSQTMQTLEHVESDKEIMTALAVAASAHKAYKTGNLIAKNPKSLGGVDVSLGFGTFESHSEQQEYREHTIPSAWRAQESIEVNATEGDATIVASSLSAKTISVSYCREIE